MLLFFLLNEDPLSFPWRLEEFTKDEYFRELGLKQETKEYTEAQGSGCKAPKVNMHRSFFFPK